MQASLEDALIKAGINATLAKGMAANVREVNAVYRPAARRSQQR
jgi:hypothetical protein